MKQQPQRRRRRAPKREEVSTTHVRKGIFFLMILLGVVSFCAVAGMLVKLMLVDHDYYEAKAIRNQTRSTSVTASRGTIYDRNGNVLAASSSVESMVLDMILCFSPTPITERLQWRSLPRARKMRYPIVEMLCEN